MTTPATQCRIGTSVAGSVTLQSLGIPEPKTDFFPFTEYEEIANGKRKGIGSAHGSWSWGFLEQAQRNTLRGYIANPSDTVFIATKKRDSSDAFNYYEVEAYWPEEPREPASVNKRLNFVLEFAYMALQADP